MDSDRDIVISLAAVIVTVMDDEPRFLRIPGKEGASLPFGLFSPTRHRTLEEGLKEWVESQTGIELSFAEQLYTFGNLYRDPGADDPKQRLLTIAYWALSSITRISDTYSASWRNWYDFFPWEDHRVPENPLYDDIRHRLGYWVDEGADDDERTRRRQRVAGNFGPGLWDDEQVLSRYELLYEAGLVMESPRDWAAWPPGLRGELPISRRDPSRPLLCLEGETPMIHDHRRILASALGRLRAKIKYRPVLFQILPDAFTLGRLQRVTEAWCGTLLHKQNFRRTLLTGDLVEEAGGIDKSGPGRPASLYRFRSRSLNRRRAPWLGLPQKRG